MNLNPVQRTPVIRENERVETIVRPGREIYKETYIQPIVQRENVNLKVMKGEDK